ncbi:hypothetical protein HBI56_119390 [Parastagonospora nodorum]|nr:hypothetical protein HBH52_029820 [Parastagonospora nodorum]KAH4053748.1 hypothetical protein HBH49_087980 [Parastagonospora nodorum]KAH4067125.1 hypothetical protein HBH50_135880 [Parastagonospora nodorum]KAH4085221.1 hypothetical protein HBH48_158090 [Parastagonospora nodorum]KAH4107841.1 hypothetical protein HBH46_049510 [Parastagonospora nodorum]
MFNFTRPQLPEPPNTEFQNTQVATLKAIEDNIIKCELRNTDVKFIPDSAVSLIATREAITRYFEEDYSIGNADKKRIEQLVDMVYKDAQKIFLIAVRCNWPAVYVQSIVDVLEYKDAIVHQEKDKFTFGTHDKDGKMKAKFLDERKLFLAKRVVPHTKFGGLNQEIPRSRLPFTSVDWDTEGHLDLYPKHAGFKIGHARVELHSDYWDGPKKLIMGEFDENPGPNPREYQEALASILSFDEETSNIIYLLTEDPGPTKTE